MWIVSFRKCIFPLYFALQKLAQKLFIGSSILTVRETQMTIE
jgi:hypothetical protein